MGRLYDELLDKVASGPNPPLPQSLARHAEMVKLASEILGSESKALRWLSLPKIALKGRVPMQLLDSDAGFDEVRALLDKVWD